METNQELLERWEFIRAELNKQMKQMERMKLGSSARTRKAMFGGCLNFALMTVESELEKRGYEKVWHNHIPSFRLHERE